MTHFNLSFRPFWALCLLVLAFSLSNCKKAPAPENTDAVVGEVLESTPLPVAFNPFPPKDLPADASPEQLVQFAWEEFIALTWQSSYAKNGKRDYPDTTWSWTNNQAAFPDLMVWETFAHRTELRPYTDKMLPFDAPPHYSFGTSLVPATPQTSFQLFNNLDENNEIGSCNVYAHVDKYGEENMVIFQAKCNRDEYEYIMNNYGTKAKLLAATSLTMQNIAKYKAYYQGATGTCNCPPQQGVICLPCGGSPDASGQPATGAIEIKTAWRKLVAEDDASQFFTREVIYYEQGPNNTIVYHNGTFALIGLHIIHKTTNFPDFIFATFEHNTVQDDNMGYVLLGSSGQESLGIQRNYPRLHPIPTIAQQGTDAVHAQMKAMNPNSIWLNYRLTGVQGQPTSDSTSFSYFLANYVVESDPALADFHGSSLGHPFDNGANILSKGQLLTMGGCKGCHGVAQMGLGTDFSFLLDTIGKPIKQPDLDAVPPGQVSKLAAYIKALQ